MSVLDGANDLKLYKQYVEPLEAEHRGKYIAIHLDGRTLMGEEGKSLRKQADAQLGKGSVIFRGRF